MEHKAFTNEEDAIIREGFQQKCTDQEISDRLAKIGSIRSRQTVMSRRRTLRLMANNWSGHKKPRKLTPDQRFKRAMMSAIKAGKEVAILGVVKDNRPWALKTIHAEPLGSCAGSPAAACAD